MDNVFLRIGDLVPYGDKVAHVLLYGCLALLLNLLLKRKVLTVKSLNFQLGSVLVLGFAVLEELSQGFFATRNLDMWDLFADVIGVYLAAILVTYKRGAH
ncbi:MAG: VanZ family protein [Cellvibrio sp.]|uniref:VanZ family protein n=1 Tax=Cellvibrio sp. TaxID=1965322 RepID=UPI0031A7118C